MASLVKTATEVEVRAIQDHKVIEWNTCWKCRLCYDPHRYDLNYETNITAKSQPHG